MNFRTTIALVVILALVIGIGVVYTRNRSNAPPTQVSTRRDFFYLVADSDIKTVNVNFRDKAQKFVQDASGTWHFNDATGAKVNLDRWGGVTLLLSGPQYKRVISEKATDLGRYGLEKPPIVIDVGLKDLGNVNIRVGDKTPDGASNYAMFQTREGIYLVDSSWGDVISRLVTEPPFITPTPVPSTPTPEGTLGADATPASGTPASTTPTPPAPPTPALVPTAKP